MPDFASVISPVCVLVLAPLLLALINRTKAFVAGRRGPPLLQPYFDIAKYLRRGAVYGDATHESILEQAGMRHASHLVLTLPHSSARC